MGVEVQASTGAEPKEEPELNEEWEHALRYSTLPQAIRDAEYAVRGKIVSRAAELQTQLDNGDELPFKQLVMCNIGNPQSVGQNPLTFNHQVLSLLTNPVAIADSTLPDDVVARAKDYISHFPKFGSYSHSQGIHYLRETVAQAIDLRDGPNVPKASPEELFFTDGASSGVKTILEMIIRGPQDGILIPIPQYPLYSASVTRLGGKWIGYELDEDYSAESPMWKLNIDEIKNRINKFRAEGGNVRALAVINPGNPTGNVLSRQELEELVRLCEQEKLVILADEVYQANVYAEGKEFLSIRKIALELGARAEVFSFMSTSKGYYGECGLRGGYTHATNIDPEVLKQLYKLMSMALCSNTLGQAMTALVMTPPKQGDPSFALFEEEKNRILGAMKKKAKLLVERINKIEGVNTMPVEGAMYAFVKIDLPQKFIEEAKTLGYTPDTLYCLRMVETIGVVCVPGSGFAQKEGTYHYRMTVLPEESLLINMMEDLDRFHTKLVADYSQ